MSTDPLLHLDPRMLTAAQARAAVDAVLRERFRQRLDELNARILDAVTDAKSHTWEDRYSAFPAEWWECAINSWVERGFRVEVFPFNGKPALRISWDRRPAHPDQPQPSRLLRWWRSL